VDGYDSVGCGESYALGAMFAAGKKLPADVAVDYCLSAAFHFSAGVRPPFHVLAGASRAITYTPQYICGGASIETTPPDGGSWITTTPLEGVYYLLFRDGTVILDGWHGAADGRNDGRIIGWSAYHG